ncbi:MAG: sensor histidine kinase [Nostocales cyanobacterium]|nr:MAG: sensor histidine kinase [Nostocales cyanobacterium]TAF19858.1 MAG: sensor histidine kinase [Nostocales cyanobacterium]
MQSKPLSKLLSVITARLKLICKLKNDHISKILFIIITILNLLIIAYITIELGCAKWKISIILVFSLNAVYISSLYYYHQTANLSKISKKAILEIAFATIHNGPIQTLEKIIRLIKDQDISNKKYTLKIEPELEKLNQELRGIYEFWQQESIIQESRLYLGNEQVLNLQDPLHEILYQVYIYTLGRDFPCFKTIKLKIRSFEPVDESSLTLEHKRGICRFLEESLCNVGKYATGVTCLKVTCCLSVGWYTLSIIDDGIGLNSFKEGRGTKQFKSLAKQINGKFQRIPIYPRGIICELSWPGC